MNFFTANAVLYLTLLVTNGIDSVNGMPGSDQNKKPSNPWKATTPRSYAAAVELGPRPPEEGKGTLSKTAIQNKKKRENRKMKKASEGSSPSTSIHDPEEEFWPSRKNEKVMKDSSLFGRAPAVTKLKAEPHQIQRSFEKSSPRSKRPITDKSSQTESSASVVEDFPILSSSPQKLSQPSRIESKVDRKTTTMPERIQEQKLIDPSPEHLESRTSSMETVKGNKRVQRKLDPSFLTFHVGHDEHGKTVFKSNEKMKETLAETRSEKIEGKKQVYVERKMSPSEKEAVQDEFVVQPESPSGPDKLKFHKETIRRGGIELKGDKVDLDSKKREPSQSNNNNNQLSRKPSKYSEEISQSSVASSLRSVWQKRESQKSSETIKEAPKKENYSQILSIDKESQSRQKKDSELKQKKSSLHQKEDISTLRGYEDISSLKKGVDESTNKDQSSTSTTNTSQIHALVPEKADPSKNFSDSEREKDAKKQSSRVNESNIISSKPWEQKQEDTPPISVLPQTISKQNKGGRTFMEEISSKSLNFGVSKQKLFQKTHNLTLQTKNNNILLSKPTRGDEAAHPPVTETLHKIELTAEGENDRIKPPATEEQESSTKIIATTRSKINVSTLHQEEGENDRTKPPATEEQESSTKIIATTISKINVSTEDKREPQKQILPEENRENSASLTSEPPSNIGEFTSGKISKDEATESFLSLLEKAGIINIDEKNKPEITGTKPISKFSIKTSTEFIDDKLAKDQESAESSQIKNIGEVRKSVTKKMKTALEKAMLANTLLITCVVEQALEKLEQSSTNPMDYGATDVVTLPGSGVIVKFNSNAGVHDLQEAILETNNLGYMLQTTSTYFSEHLLCVHDIPNNVLHFQIMYRIQLQYHESPINLHFVSYTQGFKDNYKIALFDVSDSLFNNVKKDPLIQVRWMRRRIEICLSPDKENSYLRMESDLAATSEQFMNHAVIFKVPQNITTMEINQSFFKKYREKPYQIQFSQYIRTARIKIARLRISETLLKKISLSPNIQIRWSERLISTNVVIDRCKRCQLLGHISPKCQGQKRSPSSTHENCLDCSLYEIPKITSGIQSSFQPPNTAHKTDSGECPKKLEYVAKYLSDVNKNIGNGSSLNRGSKSQTHPAKSSSEHPQPPVRLLRRKSSISEDMSSPEYNKITSENISKRPVAGISQMKSILSARGDDLYERLVDSSPPPNKATKDRIILDQTIGPKPTSNILKKEIIFEAVRQSVSETLHNILPLFYETIIEAVDQSIQESWNRLSPLKNTPSASFETCNSQDQSSRVSEDVHVEVEDREKEIQKVLGDNIVEYISSTADHSDRANAILVRGQSDEIDIYEELTKINIDWKLVNLQHTVKYPPEKLLLVCKSVEGAKYLQSVIKESSNLEIL